MKIDTFKILLCSILIISSCANSDNTNYSFESEFLAQYRNYNFGIFKNHITTIREYDESGNPVIMISETGINSKGCHLPLTVVLNKKEGSVRNIKQNLKNIVGNCYLDTVTMTRLAIEMYSIKLSSIRVDSNNNIFVGKKFGKTKVYFAYFPDTTKVTNQQFKFWRIIEDKWYKRIKSNPPY